MTTKRLEKTSPKFFCEKCDFKCFTNTDWNRHIARAKHIKTTNNNDINLENFKPKYVCVNCEKEYNDRAGLCRHKKKCSEKNEVNNVCDEINVTPKMILDIIQQNQEFKELINQKLDKARNDLELIKSAYLNDSNNGTEDTSPTFKAFEEGSETMSKEANSQLAIRQEKFIRDLRNALVRIENKTYGMCKVTGKLINKERLKIVPHATMSIEAKNLQR